MIVALQGCAHISRGCFYGSVVNQKGETFDLVPSFQCIRGLFRHCIIESLFKLYNSYALLAVRLLAWHYFHSHIEP